jgi:hypothetical protein
MYSAAVERKRAEAAAFRHVARLVSLHGHREWCLRRAASLEKEAEGLEKSASIARALAETMDEQCTG